MKYQIIYADPPWEYDDKGCNGAAEKHYKTMTLDDIANLPVAKIADTNCVLFIWVTGPFLFDAEKVINGWGFKFKTLGFTWVKRNKNAWTWFWGGGHWTRANSELCLIAVKGKPKRINAAVHQIIETRVGKHSEKPGEARTKIVKLMGDLPRIELFACVTRPGWDSLGYSVDGRDIRESILDKIEQKGILE